MVPVVDLISYIFVGTAIPVDSLDGKKQGTRSKIPAFSKKPYQII